jgi:hypothetical protein
MELLVNDSNRVLNLLYTPERLLLNVIQSHTAVLVVSP